MNNSFLFIIPLCPPQNLTQKRVTLRDMCLKALLAQNYNNWHALLIGTRDDRIPCSKQFHCIEFEGFKEEKLQIATKHIIETNLEADYIIRLDDDDIFNPRLLKHLSLQSFDLYVDKYHSFFNSSTGEISQKIMYWFPNTCVVKRQHALTIFGNFPIGEYKRYRTQCLLIENEHNDFHKYFSQKHIVKFAAKKAPVYLRILSRDSITSMNSESYQKYLSMFGYWRKNRLKDFDFLNSNNFQGRARQSFGLYINELKSNVVALLNYSKIVLSKDGVE